MSTPRPGTRVLIVEDEAIIAMTAEDMVEEIGCVVAATACSLEDALKAAERADFDIALLDINLNGDASMPLATWLREKGKPFLFTTGYGNSIAFTEFAGNPVLAKPYRADQLAAKIAEMLGA